MEEGKGQPRVMMMMGRRNRMAVKKESVNETDRGLLLSDDDDGEYLEMAGGENDVKSKKKKKVVTSSSSGKKGSFGEGMRCCQADKCMADLKNAKPYHSRHKVCEYHFKAQFVLVDGIRQRFCQQCSRFHDLSEFDEAKRSCRERLAGHNQRRRKNAAESHTEGSSYNPTGTQLKDMVYGEADDRGRIKITIKENATCRHFHIDRIS